MATTLSISKACDELPAIVNNAKKKLAEYIVTVNGSPAAVIISAAEYESWKETNEILNDPQLLKAIQKGEEDLRKGNYITFDELKKVLNLHA